MIGFFIIIGVIILYFIYIYNRIQGNVYPKKEEVRVIFREISTKYDLSYDRGSMFDLPRVSGFMEGQRITFSFSRNNIIMNMRLELWPPEKSYYRIIARKKNLVREETENAAPRTIITGDPDFDDCVLLDGNDSSTATAFLNKRTRSLIYLLQSNAPGFEIAFDKITACYTLDYFINCHLNISESIPQFVELGSRLSSQAGEKECLIRNVTTEELGTVRAANLRQLITYPAFDDDIRAVFGRALDDESVDVVVAAVSGLGESYEEKLYPFIFQGSSETREKAIRGLAMIVTSVDAKRFTGMYKTESRVNVRVAIIDLFGKTGQADARDFLLGELASETTDVTLHAIRALSTCGDIGTVSRLCELCLRKSGVDTMTRTEAVKSIEAIQKRFGVRGKGSLSISAEPEDSGSLSLQSGSEGNLSLESGIDRKNKKVSHGNSKTRRKR
jgi:hypothetical protein